MLSTSAHVGSHRVHSQLCQVVVKLFGLVYWLHRSLIFHRWSECFAVGGERTARLIVCAKWFLSLSKAYWQSLTPIECHFTELHDHFSWLPQGQYAGEKELAVLRRERSNIQAKAQQAAAARLYTALLKATNDLWQSLLCPKFHCRLRAYANYPIFCFWSQVNFRSRLVSLWL